MTAAAEAPFALAAHGDLPALIDPSGAALSYRELDRRVDALAERLVARSVLLCLTRNCPGAVIGYLAALRARAVPILMDHQTSPAALLQIAATYQPRAIWAPEAQAGAFPGYAERVSADGHSLLESERAEPAQLHPALALLLTTSGSTGSPKLVRVSYENLRANTASIVSYLSLGPEQRTISTLPFNYSFGLSILNTFLSVGGSIVLSEATLFQREFWDALRQHRVSSLSGVPYTFEMLKKVRFLGMELPALSTLTQAGGKLSVELCREFAAAAEAQGRRFFVMYGATEATARMAYLPPHEALRKAGSIGVAIPGGSFSLETEGGPVLGSGVVGELVYRGPNVTLGYAEALADLARGDDLGGVLRTGDLAQRDDDGLYTVVGRTKRFIKLFGVRTNLDEVEQLVRRAFPGLEVASTGEDNRLVVCCEDGAACDAVRSHLVQTLRVTPAAIAVRHVPALPRSPSGKVRYGEL